tara:strand:- start:6844 stop:7698 length:855 start_codon:yes stop_codon:yes gene_type:complete
MKILNKNKNRIVIFGSNGFIASNLINILKKKNQNFISIPKSKIDLTNKIKSKKIKNLLKNNDTVIFISALAPVKDIVSFNKNIDMACNFIDNIKKIKIKKFIYISSDAVYSDSNNSLNEYSKTSPDNLHGLMHLTREKLFKQHFNKITIIRPTLIYGFNDPHNGYGPNSFYRLAKKNQNINLFGKGEELRDHVHISDVVNSIYKICKTKKNDKFNVCSGSLISFYEIAKLIIKTTGSKSKIIFNKRKTPMPHNGYRPISNKFIKKTIKFNFLKFKDGIKLYEKI